MIRCLGATPAHPPTNAGSARFSTTPKVTQLAQLTPSPPIIEYYSSLHHCNRLLRLYTAILILAGFMMVITANPDLFFTVSDPASHDRFESFKDEIQELVQQNYTNKEVVAALARRGVITSLRSLERHLRTWGIPRPQTSQITDYCAQQTSMQIMAVEALLITVYSTWVTT